MDSEIRVAAARVTIIAYAFAVPPARGRYPNHELRVPAGRERYLVAVRLFVSVPEHGRGLRP